MISCQGSYCRNNKNNSEWTFPVDPGLNEQNLDWVRWQGKVPKIPFNPERYFCWHKYYAYNSGIIGNLLPHRFQPLMLATGSPEFPRHLDTFRAETGLEPLEDLARPLGQEFAIALDGPALPVPSWKLILEVYDPQAVEHALEVLVARFHESARERGETVTLRITVIENGGRTFRSIAAEGRPEAASTTKRPTNRSPTSSS